MTDNQRAEESPDTTPPAQNAPGARRRLLVKAAGIGAAMPVVLTISRSAFAQTPSSAASTGHSGGPPP